MHESCVSISITFYKMCATIGCVAILNKSLQVTYTHALAYKSAPVQY